MLILKERGHSIHVVARDKDVLLSVLEEEKVDYIVFGVHKKNILMKLLAVWIILCKYYRIIRVVKPDIIISKASFYSALLAKLTGCKSIIFPDSEVVLLTNKVVVPLVDKIVTPETFELDYGKKHVKIPGFFENCYLHPDIVDFSSEKLEVLKLERPYVILRFIGWAANHDIGKQGITNENKEKIVEMLESKYHVYISSEKPLPDKLKKYSLKIPASLIHYVLHNANLYIGDSQTMATEAALLGTPAIRTNSFVGSNDMSNFKILESKYGLLRNVAIDGNLFAAIEELSKDGMKCEWMEQSKRYFQSIGNSNIIIADLIENV